MMKEQMERVGRFRALHHTGDTLVLPNAWDVISARIFEEAGFSAIASTSSGVSFSMGYQDGEHMPPDLLLRVLARMTAAVQIPVSADIERGYAKGDEKRFAGFIGDLVKTGVVGINLEDGDAAAKTLHEIEAQTKLIGIVKEVTRQQGGDLFINARTDAMMYAPGDKADKIRVCIERAAAFEEAGADGIFVPFVRDMDTVRALKGSIRLPLNILIDENLDIAGLRKLGINRISTGSHPILATLSLLKRLGEALREGDQWDPLFTNGVTYADANRLLARR